jgi:UDP-N-acetylmuramoyl-tripeptide--D-alanyl-D-alanine ligase
LHGSIKTSLVGNYNLPNVLAAAAIGKYFSIADDQITHAISNYQPTNSRSQLVTKGSNTIILDAYNANPSSMKLAIENFAKQQHDNKILVLGAMAELGEESVQEHQDIIDQIGSQHWKEVILVGGDFQKLSHPYRKFNSSEEAGNWIASQKPENAYLLIKGSRSAQMEKILSHLQ